MPFGLFPHPGPTLPPFETLLVKGPYFPSAPLHLCLSHLRSEPHARKALVLTPRRQAFAAALEEFNDQWLTTHSGKGEIADLLSKTDVLYVAVAKSEDPHTIGRGLMQLSTYPCALVTSMFAIQASDCSIEILR